jgi:FkbM family methyltransferase
MAIGDTAKSAAKKFLERMGLHVARGPANRFEAMEHALMQLRSRGYAPRVVIDGGANVGRWTELAHTIFPDADYLLVEPQPACLPALQDVARRRPRVQVFNYALTEPGRDSVTMIGSDSDSTSEGAWIPLDSRGANAGLQVPANTLDALFAKRSDQTSRTFLKLDLEGYEYSAFLGATELLKSVEVILSEVRFYDVERSGHHTFTDIVSLLREHRFIVYDVVRLLPRSRDGRLFFGDVLFVRKDAPLAADVSWR